MGEICQCARSQPLVGGTIARQVSLSWIKNLEHELMSSRVGSLLALFSSRLLLGVVSVTHCY